MPTRIIEVVDYDPRWPEVFAQLRDRVWPFVEHVATSVEHVGSTSVPGLAAKPIVDITVIVPSRGDLPEAIEGLTRAGYVHKGDLGVEGREAFANPEGLPAHHMYLCPSGSLGLRNQIAVRDYLRTNPATVHEYAELKKRLATRHRYDIDSYITGKTDLILRILRESGLTVEELDRIEAANRNLPGGTTITHRDSRRRL